MQPTAIPTTLLMEWVTGRAQREQQCGDRSLLTNATFAREVS